MYSIMTVNQLVVGSIPAAGAKIRKNQSLTSFPQALGCVTKSYKHL